MTDIKCRVCLEPWDFYGVYHGDMTRWEAELFKKGAGCPSCEGVQPEGLTDDRAFEEWGRNIVMDGPDDPDDWMGEVFVTDAGGKYVRPKWEMPDPVVRAECAGCHVKLVEDQEEAYVCAKRSLVWWGGERVHYYMGVAHEFTAHPETEFEGSLDDFIEIAGNKYCPLCAQWCDECHEVGIFCRQDLEPGDPYEPGSAFSRGMREQLCINCHEAEDTGEEE